jgi:hypothetical protein
MCQFSSGQLPCPESFHQRAEITQRPAWEAQQLQWRKAVVSLHRKLAYLPPLLLRGKDSVGGSVAARQSLRLWV